MLSKPIIKNVNYDKISDFITAFAEIAGMKKRTIVANTVVKLVNEYKLKKNLIFKFYTLKIIIAYLKIFAKKDDDMLNEQACRKALRETLEALPVDLDMVKSYGWNRILKKYRILKKLS